MASTEIHGVDPLAVRANKLELVERLADDLAHEIKNPLHSMVINLEVLKRRVSRSENPDTGELLRYTGILGAELERVNRRVELLLRMVRRDRGGEPVTLGETLEETLELLELERSRLGVTLEYQPGPPMVRGHIARDAARQLVLNLLLAALDSIPSGGSIRVTTEAAPDAERIRLLLVSPPGNPAADAADTHGLTLARALCAGVGGQLLVESDTPGVTSEGRESLWLLSIPVGAP